jgi:hypothetical protein
MPMYEFQSKDGERHEKYFRVGKCPKSIQHKKKKYFRVYSIPSVGVDTNKPKTVGALAEANTRQLEKERGLPKPKPQPWWRKNKKPDKSLAKLSAAQKTRYIMEGKK